MSFPLVIVAVYSYTGYALYKSRGTTHLNCDENDTLGIGQCSDPIPDNSISHKSRPSDIIGIISMLRQNSILYNEKLT